MKIGGPYASGDTIVAIAYDIAEDTFLATLANGGCRDLGYTPAAEELAHRYAAWLRDANNIPGHYCTSYAAAVDAFVAGRA